MSSSRSPTEEDPRLVFSDLVGPERKPSAEEDAWLAAIASDTDPTSHAVSVAPSRAAEEPEPVLRRELDGSWRAGRYVGELRRDGRVLEIKPRLGIDAIAEWASAALNVRVIPRAAEFAGTSALIAQLLAASWRSSVTRAARHGPPSLREAVIEEGAYARGQLDVPRTLELRALGKARIATRRKAKRVDNPVARSIVLADRVLDRQMPDGWRGERLEEIVPRLQGAVGRRPALPTRRQLDRVRYTPISLPYKRAAEISWQIARNRGLRARASAERTEGVLIDVAELWELFLVRCAKRAFGAAAVSHGTRKGAGRRLLQSEARPTSGIGRLYPDILVQRPGAAGLVIDAKYKPLADPRGVDREDLYQIASYANAWRDSTETALLGYPDFETELAPARAAAHGPWRSPDGSRIRFERLPLTERPCAEALADL